MKIGLWCLHLDLSCQKFCLSEYIIIVSCISKVIFWYLSISLEEWVVGKYRLKGLAQVYWLLILAQSFLLSQFSMFFTMTRTKGIKSFDQSLKIRGDFSYFNLHFLWKTKPVIPFHLVFLRKYGVTLVFLQIPFQEILLKECSCHNMVYKGKKNWKHSSSTLYTSYFLFCWNEKKKGIL